MTGSAKLSANEHRFVQIWSFLAILTIVVGFTPSFYGRAFVDDPPGNPLNALTVAHGLLFTAWILLFAWQVLNIARGRYARHRALGWTALAFVPIALASGLIVALEHASRPTTGDEPIPPDVFLLLPIFEVVNACILILLGWLHRKTPHIHKRMMLFAIAAMVGTGSGRIAGFLGTFVVPALFVLAIWAFDLIRAKRLHRWVLGGGAIAVSTYLVPLAVGFSEPWRTMARAIIETWKMLS
ncbi:hypothetical protein GRI42_00235 [Erythrobacter gaetbuli]|uniref:DUF2306 domain-containing protein n=1 Tax=Qipengyuania gaetbuli TaxID=266952 RepID=A0A844XXT3_9SPHN|nr:hypothetical protein [Qipengyuania gaetbuli]MXO49732.1 hypothetical protein [Qipengyuania gaetbuli]